MDVCKLNKSVTQDLLQTSFSRSRVAEKLKIIKTPLLAFPNLRSKLENNRKAQFHFTCPKYIW